MSTNVEYRVAAHWRSELSPEQRQQIVYDAREGVIRRIARKVHADPVSGCWIWLGALDRYGYGTFGIGPRRAYLAVGAHRASYIAHKGPFPADLCLDHLCHNRACVNPEHLEPVTTAENNRRARQYAP